MSRGDTLSLGLILLLVAGCAGPAPPELRGYEVWTPMSRYGWPEDITRFMARKLRAVQCYRSQLRAFRRQDRVRGSRYSYLEPFP